MDMVKSSSQYGTSWRLADERMQYELMKKKNAAKKAGGAKKKEEKPEGSSVPEKGDEAADDKKEDAAALESVEAPSASPGPVEDDEPSALPQSTATNSTHGRKPSVAVESRQRSASFYRGSGTPTSPTVGAPGVGVSGDIYREQAQRIEELERDNKRLTVEVEAGQKKWKSNEEELEELRESRGDVALVAEKSKEAEKLVSWFSACSVDAG
jgi:hypothetical protein